MVKTMGFGGTCSRPMDFRFNELENTDACVNVDGDERRA